MHLPAESPHNALLRIRDVAEFIDAPPRRLLDLRLEEAPPRCMFRCPSVNECRQTPKCRGFPERWQRDLSRFFYLWDRGRLVKARNGKRWALFPRHSPPQAPIRQDITMGIDLTLQGPRLKVL
jgi:hypothetical protein